MTNPVIDTYGHRRWYNSDGQLHRTDGPAFIDADGTQHWYLCGLCHRKDGPAVIYADGTQDWYINGKHHRTDGPAVIRPTGNNAWYRYGVELPAPSVQMTAQLPHETTDTFVSLQYSNGTRFQIPISVEKAKSLTHVVHNDKLFVNPTDEFVFTEVSTVLFYRE